MGHEGIMFPLLGPPVLVQHVELPLCDLPLLW